MALGVALLMLGLTAGPSSASQAPPPLVSDQALEASVLPLAVDDAVLDLSVTAQRTDGSVSDSLGPGGRTVTLATDVLFGFGSATLTAQAASRLEEAAAAARTTGKAVTVIGYTDSIGSATSNLALSTRRAAVVRDALAPQLPGVAFTVRGRGEETPVAPNTRPDGSDNPLGRAANRRVTLTMTR